MRTSYKMYLTLIFSTACICVYQYQLSKARLISSASQQSLVLNEVLHLQQSQLLATKYYNKKKPQLRSINLSSASSATSTTTRLPNTTTSRHTLATKQLPYQKHSKNKDKGGVSTENNAASSSYSSTSSKTSTNPPIHNNIQSSINVQTDNTQNIKSNSTSSGHVIIYLCLNVFSFSFSFFFKFFFPFFLLFKAFWCFVCFWCFQPLSKLKPIRRFNLLSLMCRFESHFIQKMSRKGCVLQKSAFLVD